MSLTAKEWYCANTTGLVCAGIGKIYGVNGNELLVYGKIRGHNGLIPSTGFNPGAYATYGGGAGSGAGVRAYYHPPPVFYFYPSPPVSPTAPPHLYQPPAHLVTPGDVLPMSGSPLPFQFEALPSSLQAMLPPAHPPTMPPTLPPVIPHALQPPQTTIPNRYVELFMVN